MIKLHEWIATASVWSWPKIADHLWQATLFVIVVLLASLLLRRGPARLRHTIWLLASVKFIIPATLLVFIGQQIGLGSLWLWLTSPGPSADAFLQVIAEPVTVLTNSYQLTVSDSSAAGHVELYCTLTGIWLVGCTVLSVGWWRGRSKCRQALKLSRPTETGREWQALQSARNLLSLRRDVKLVLSPLPVEPGVFKVWKPVILLPESMAVHLDDDELLAIMLHELVHVQRRDNLVGRMQLAVTGLFWFHPLVWFISRRLFDEREHACDERVLEICGAPETYAASILKVVRFSFGWNVAGVTGAGGGSNLRRRIENIMATGNEKRSAGLAIRLFTAVVLGVALMAIVAAGTHNRGSAKAAHTIERQELAGNLEVAGLLSEQKSGARRDQTPQPPQPPAPPQSVNPIQPAAPESESQPPVPPTPDNLEAPAQPANPPQPPTPEQPPVPPAKPASTQEKSEKPREDKQDVKKGELIEAPRPIYPDEARAKRVEGEVTVKIVIGDEGNVISARPTSGPELLKGAAKDAAMKARFKPTLLNGKPVKVSGVMTYSFVLDEKEKQ
jgi:TonB family protein